MDDEVTLTGDESVLASRIKTIDRDLEALEQRTQESVILGLHGSGAAMMTNMAQTSADNQKASLLAERADLVKKLQAEIAKNKAGPSGASQVPARETADLTSSVVGRSRDWQAGSLRTRRRRPSEVCRTAPDLGREVTRRRPRIRRGPQPRPAPSIG